MFFGIGYSEAPVASGKLSKWCSATSLCSFASLPLYLTISRFLKFDCAFHFLIRPYQKRCWQKKLENVGHKNLMLSSDTRNSIRIEVEAQLIDCCSGRSKWLRASTVMIFLRYFVFCSQFQAVFSVFHMFSLLLITRQRDTHQL